MTDHLKTHRDLAEKLRLPLSTTIELRKREKWPCLKFGRSIRFTDEQIAQIIASHIKAEQPAEQAPVIGGLTARAGKRRAG